jgi:hypothetical protein
MARAKARRFSGPGHGAGTRLGGFWWPGPRVGTRLGGFWWPGPPGRPTRRNKFPTAKLNRNERNAPSTPGQTQVAPENPKDLKSGELRAAKRSELPGV